MPISSLGVGSGLALDDLVSQLLEAERKPKEDRLNKREDENEARLSGIGNLISKASDFKDAVEALKKNFDKDTRTATISHPDSSSDEDSDGPFTAEASNSAVAGSYQIAVTQLASGSRIETADASAGGFAASSDPVLTSGSGSLTFKVDGTGDSFSVDVTAGMTLLQLRNKINDDENNFGVNASIINTGTTDGGVKLVFTSDVTGAGNDLAIVNDNDLAELNRVSTTDSAETASYLAPVKTAQNAMATIDGILVESSSNKFENTIENVTFEASSTSTLAADGITYKTSTLNIGFDKDALEGKVRDFVDEYNSLIKELDKLSKVGESELEDDGALAGDFMIRGLQNGLGSILSSGVSASALGSIFAVGIEFDKDGKLSIPESDDLGLGTGAKRLEDAVENNFDEITKLFTDPTEGIAVRLEEYIEQYTKPGGLLKSRESNFKEERDNIFDDRAALELRLLNTEQTLRDKYVNLDLTVSKLQSTGSALMASLSNLG